MSAETIFILVNILALLGWMLILVAPYARITRKLVDSMVIPALLAVVYVLLLIFVLPTVPFEDYSFLGLAELFSDPWVMALGWTHLVAFDLVAAVWMKQDAKKHKIRHRVMILPYLLTFFFGPAGLLLYLLLSTSKRNAKKRGR